MSCSCEGICSCYFVSACTCHNVCGCNSVGTCDGFSSCDCQTVCSVECAPNCGVVCAKNCNSVSAKTDAYGVPDISGGSPPSVTIFERVRLAINNYRARFGYAASSLTVTEGAKVLADDWNTKIRTPILEAVYQTGLIYQFGAPILPTASLDIGSAVQNQKINTKKPNDVISALNTRYCYSVAFGYCHLVSTCAQYGCGSYQNCQSQCACDVNIRG